MNTIVSETTEYGKGVLARILKAINRMTKLLRFKPDSGFALKD